MAWSLFAFALTLVYLAQTAVLPYLGVTWLDGLLVVALVCGLTAPTAEARLAGWITGLSRDIGGTGPVGLHALALGLATLVLTYLRDLVNREVWWVRALVAFAVAWPAQLLVRLHERYFQGAALPWVVLLAGSFGVALVAAVIASVVPRVPALFGRRPRHYSARRWW